eukprot:1981160-Pyramimonas_sp.AAC.1
MVALELEAFSKLGLTQVQVFQYIGRCQEPRLRWVPLLAAQVEGPCQADRDARFWQAAFVELKLLLKLVPRDSIDDIPPQPHRKNAAQCRATLAWLSQQVPPSPSDPSDAGQRGTFDLWRTRFQQIPDIPFDGLHDLLSELQQVSEKSRRDALQAQKASWKAWLQGALL